LTCGDEGIGVEESAPLGIVITGLEVIQLCLGIIDITTIPQGIKCAEGWSQGTAGGEDITPCVVGILRIQGPTTAPGSNAYTSLLSFFFLCLCIVIILLIPSATMPAVNKRII